MEISRPVSLLVGRHSVDTQAALTVDGAIAIFTVADIPGSNQWGTIIADRPWLAINEVQYMGQPIAVVVAKTQQIAQKAAKRITVLVVLRK